MAANGRDAAWRKTPSENAPPKPKIDGVVQCRRTRLSAKAGPLTNGVNFAQPDITLKLDRSGVIQRAVLANAIASEGIAGWVGRRWSDTVAGDEEQLQQMLDDAWSSGTSAFRQVRQRFPSGRELPIEYTTMRLGAQSGLIAIGRSLEAVAEVRARLAAARASMERSAWKLRDFETHRLLFETATQPVLLIRPADLAILLVNPAATRALGLARDGDLLAMMGAEQRGPFRAMLDRLEDEGNAPGIVLRIGQDRRSWLVRASLVAAEGAPVFLLKLSPAGLAPALADEGSGKLDKSAMREMVGDAVAAVERKCIVAALAAAKGDRQAVAQSLGITVESLDAKLDGFSFE